MDEHGDHHVTARKVGQPRPIFLPNLDLSNGRIQNTGEKKVLLKMSDDPYARDAIYNIKTDELEEKIMYLKKVCKLAGIKKPFKQEIDGEQLAKFKNTLDEYMGIKRGHANPMD